MNSEAFHIQRHARPALGRGYLPLLACAALLLSGCSSEPLPPTGAIWTGSSNARTAALAPVATGNASAKPLYKAASGGDWGPYSGRRGQTEPPASMTYAFKGDPNASRTFAAAPGQM